jgi:hypothetical protein
MYAPTGIWIRGHSIRKVVYTYSCRPQDHCDRQVIAAQHTEWLLIAHKPSHSSQFQELLLSVKEVF